MQAPVRITDIETQARAYGDARDRLRELCAALEAGMKELQREHLPGIRRALNRAAEAEAALVALVEQAPELFVRPKSVVFHGIKVGYQKGRGGIEWDDADAVVSAILEKLPGQSETLIRWTGKPIKEALNSLDVATLRRLGCRVIDTGEEVIVRPVDSALEKMADALLKAATEEARA